MDPVLCAHPRLHFVGIRKHASTHHRYFALLALLALGAAGVRLVQRHRIEAALAK